MQVIGLLTNRDAAIAQIAEHFGVHYMTVSRAVRDFEDQAHKMLEC